MRNVTYIFILVIGMSIFLFSRCTEKIPEGPERIEVLKVALLLEENKMDYVQENHWDNRFKLPPKGMTMDEFEEVSDWRIPFRILVTNDFDEAFDGKRWIKIKVNVWSANPDDDWFANVSFTDTTTSRYFTLPPKDSLVFYTGNKLVWNQREVNGKSIHETNPFTPIWVECIEFDSLIYHPDEKEPEVIPWRYCDTLLLAPTDTVIAFDRSKKIFAQAEVQLFKNYHVVKSDTIEFRIHYYFPPEGFRKKFWCFERERYANDPPCPF